MKKKILHKRSRIYAEIGRESSREESENIENEKENK